MEINRDKISDRRFWINVDGESPKGLTRISENNVVSSLEEAKNGKWTCVDEDIRKEILCHVKSHEKCSPIWIKIN